MRQRKHNHRITASGASLIEVMVVISLCAIAVALTIGYTTFLHQTWVRSALDELHATCHYLRMKTLVTGVPEVLVLHEEDHSYSWDATKVTLPKTVRYGVLPGVQGPPSSPIRPVTSAITFKNSQIVFAATGVIQPGTVYLIDSTHTYGYAFTSSVAAYSYLRRYGYYDGTWHRIT